MTYLLYPLAFIIKIYTRYFIAWKGSFELYNPYNRKQSQRNPSHDAAAGVGGEGGAMIFERKWKRFHAPPSHSAPQSLHLKGASAVYPLSYERSQHGRQEIVLKSTISRFSNRRR
ncbi:hypothetical protein EVAR_24635_1 [Eumeta japonica]|uniref:Uncharacterized protein n=1 Tax=Eumeta variegata TaxID=151549 RepID=A0A4C1V141_EUMVA|nr:hypothetical protein EVAR_24635_1 [Eumeta japonica]